MFPREAEGERGSWADFPWLEKMTGREEFPFIFVS